MKFVKHPSSRGPRDEASMLAEYRVSGSLELLGHLYEPYMPLVYGLCLKYLKKEDESKDAVMQIFEQLIEKLRVHQVANFKSWLYTLARNHCLMALRQAERHPTVSMDDSNMENTSFSYLVDTDQHEDQFKLMEKCMQKLPADQRVCVQLFYLEQKCYKEVAELTAFDMNKVKSSIQNGKRNLKICMEKNSGE